MTGKNDAPTLCIELRPHSQTHFVGLPAKHLRVNRPHEGVHAIETFWCRAGRQPFEIAVGTRDIAVRAGRDMDDDFATHLKSCGRLARWRKGASFERLLAALLSG